VNWRWPLPLQVLLEDSESQILFVTANSRRRSIHPRTASLLLQIVSSIPSWTTTISAVGRLAWTPLTQKLDSSLATTAIQLYTSGTTGRPKGALVPTYLFENFRLMATIKSGVLGNGIRPSPQSLPPPLFHIGGITGLHRRHPGMPRVIMPSSIRSCC